jgi:hypothetical protein
MKATAPAHGAERQPPPWLVATVIGYFGFYFRSSW